MKEVIVKGFSREQDRIIAELIDLVKNRGSREELILSFCSKFFKHSDCSSIFAIQAIEPSPLKSTNWELSGISFNGIHEMRWKNFCEYIQTITAPDNWLPKLIKKRKDEGLISRIWSSSKENEKLFSDIFRIVNKDKAEWISVLFLPAPSVNYPIRILIVTYEGSEEAEYLPRGGTQDWRLLLFFKQIYELAIFDVRNVAKQILLQRKMILQDLAPSIIHHEINSRIVNSERALELLIDSINFSEPDTNRNLKDLIESLSRDIKNIKSISHSVMGLNRRAGTIWVNFKEELLMVKDLTSFRSKKIGGRIIIECDDNLKIKTDSAFLLHILVNLINNSIDSMTLKKKITRNSNVDYNPKLELIVTLFQDSSTDTNKVILDVIDNGIGIIEGASERIFEAGVTTKQDGHGLGLSISKMVAGYIGADLLFKYSAPDKGTCFRLILPIECPPIGDLQDEMESTI